MKTQQEITEIFNILQTYSGAIELDHVNDYTLLVAVVLSARATDKGVNKATKELFKIVQTPQAMVDLGLEKLEEYVKTIGLFKTKAKNIITLSEILIKEHNGIVPNNRDALVALPGVGRKTANVVLNEAFEQEAFPVDTHVFRVTNRLGLCITKTPEQTEKVLEEIVPKPYRLNASQSMVLYGRYICKALKPACQTCQLQQFCDFYKNKK